MKKITVNISNWEVKDDVQLKAARKLWDALLFFAIVNDKEILLSGDNWTIRRQKFVPRDHEFDRWVCNYCEKYKIDMIAEKK